MRRITRLADGTVMQGAMFPDRGAMATEGGMPSHALGVVLSVQVSDAATNRSSFQRSDLRGYVHEASVLIMNADGEPYLRVNNAVICPDHVTGLDNYVEQLPRPCTQTINGTAFNGQLNNINPYDLDGDWCIVSFIGGSIRQPFVSSWWPSPRNTYDPQTSGNGNPNSRGQGQTLDQRGRYFRRVNGLETVITDKGDLYFSTKFANSTIQYGQAQATAGRFARQLSDNDGGSISIDIKPSQSLLINFNPQIEGAHHLSGFENDLPQTNPRTSRSVESRNTDDTSITITKTDIRMSTSHTVDVKATEDVILTGNNSVQLNGDEQVTVESPDIQLGTTAPEKLIMATKYNTNTQQVLLDFIPTLATLKSAITAATSTSDLAVAVNGALDGLTLVLNQLQQQINASVTTKTKAE